MSVDEILLRSRFTPLRNILCYDVFDRGFNGWMTLMPNFTEHPDFDVPPTLVDKTQWPPVMLSSATFRYPGTHGSMSGTYSLKLSTRPVAAPYTEKPAPGSLGHAIKRLSFWRPGSRYLQIECWFSYTAEQDKVDDVVYPVITINTVAGCATQIPDPVLTLHLGIFPFLGVHQKTHILPVQFAVRLIVNEFQMAVRYPLEAIVAAVRITPSEPPWIHTSHAPVTVQTESPVLVGAFGGVLDLPFLNHPAVNGVEITHPYMVASAAFLNIEPHAEIPYGTFVEPWL